MRASSSWNLGVLGLAMMGRRKGRVYVVRAKGQVLTYRYIWDRFRAVTALYDGLEREDGQVWQAR